MRGPVAPHLCQQLVLSVLCIFVLLLGRQWHDLHFKVEDYETEGNLPKVVQQVREPGTFWACVTPALNTLLLYPQPLPTAGISGCGPMPGLTLAQAQECWIPGPPSLFSVCLPQQD